MILFGFIFLIGFFRMKRFVEMNVEFICLINIVLEMNIKRWVLLGFSFIGGVMIVVFFFVIIKLVRILIILLVI